LGQD